MIHQERWCFRLCRSWTPSWSRVAGMPTVKSAEMTSFPDGFLLISTSDREMPSPCEPLLPPFGGNVGSFLPVFLRYFLRCVFRGSDNANSAGQVKLTIGYSVEEGRLFITVHACRFPSYFLPVITRHICPSGAHISSCVFVCVCVYFTPTGLWQHAPRTVPTLTFPSFCYPTKRPPPKGEPPPKRETSIQNSTRGRTSK